ncbi:MAG: hypothetical protein E7648_02180 [Ruminococcaceae bacterium]|nr:hypothetical protein [Oscillospiraceae bacterium]
MTWDLLPNINVLCADTRIVSRIRRNRLKDIAVSVVQKMAECFEILMPYGREPRPEEIREGIKRCGLTRKQWDKKRREKKNRKKARKRK